MMQSVVPAAKPPDGPEPPIVYLLVRQKLTMELGAAAMKDREEVGAAAADYLAVAGYVCLGWCWLAAAGVAAKKLAAGDAEADFYRAKLVTAKHYFDRILPRVDSHAAAARAGAAGLMSLPAEHFAFA